jgi:hypothetical protein
MHYAWQAGILFSIFSFSIRPAVFLAGGGVEPGTEHLRHFSNILGP